MTEAEFRSHDSETGRYRKLTVPLCKGNVVDVGSGGDPVVPHAIQIELPVEEYAHYHSGDARQQPSCCYRCHATELPFKDATIDTLYSSHLLEDYLDWMPCLKEWTRVLKRGGRLIVLMPDKELWAKELERGRIPNCLHRKEGRVGALTVAVATLPLRVEMDRLTKLVEVDYSIIFVATKL